MPFALTRRFAAVLWAGLVASAALQYGCFQVRPEGDFDRFSGLIRERTSQSEVFDPANEPLVDEQVARLLEGGLSVNEAVQVAMLANRGLQSLFAEIGASRADLVQSQLLSNPSLGFSARFPEGGGRSNLTLNFGQELVDLWQIPVRKRIAEAKLEQVVFDAARQGIELMANVKTKCYRVLGLRQIEASIQDSVALVDRSLSLADARFKAGETGILDVNLVRSNLLQVQLDLMGAQRDCRVAEAELAEAIGLSRSERPWQLNDSLPPPSAGINDDATMIMMAMERRFEAQSARQEVLAADGELRRQWLNIVPSASIGVELERPERRALPGRDILADTARASIRAGALTAPDIQTRAERDLERRQIIDSLLGPTLSITLPIYDQNQAQIAKARFVADQKRKQYELLLDRVAREVRTSAAIARTAADVARFFEKESLPQARENLEAARKSYEAGEQNVLALIESQEAFIRLQREYIGANRDQAIAMAELERALGGALSPTASTNPADTKQKSTEPGLALRSEPLTPVQH